MAKKAWVTPVGKVQIFRANEYISSCGDTDQVYKFTCDAYKGSILFGLDLGGYVFLDENGDGRLSYREYLNPSNRLGRYRSCKETHEAPTDAEFLRGFLIPYTSIIGDIFNIPDYGESMEVMVWRGENNDNVHCTVKLDKDSWEIVKS